MKKWLPTAIKLLVVALLIWGVRGALIDAFEKLRHGNWQIDYGWLALAGFFYLLGQLPSGLFWWHVMRRLGQAARLIPTLRAYYIGHLGKYVPGKALVVVLRAGLVRGPGVDTAVAAVTVFVETLTTIAVGACLSALILAIRYHEDWRLMLLAIGCMIIAGLPTIPAVFQFVIRSTRVGRAFPTIVDRLQRLDYRTLAAGWLGIAIGWLVMGLSLWATLRGMGVNSVNLKSEWPLLTAAVALSVVAGFLSLLPGGAVVRELVLFQLLGRLNIGNDEALRTAVVIVLRLVSLVAELGISVILYPMGFRWSRTSNEGDASRDSASS